MTQGFNKFLEGADNFGTSIGGNIGGAIKSGVGLVQGVRQLFGAPGSNTVSPGAEGDGVYGSRQANFVKNNSTDWRVKLSMPPIDTWTNALTGVQADGNGSDYSSGFQTSVMTPLINTNGFIFPYTPSVTLTHAANYSSMDPIHNNYPFSAYENSKLDKITITGDFYCETSYDAAYWIAGVHFFRTMTKMFFGEGTNAGSPPPIIKLNGYGDFVFKNVPVAVTQFSVELPKDVDYIPSSFLAANQTSATQTGTGYVPVKSVFTVTLLPMYSRESVRKFNLNDFATGKLISGGGFI
jgi:hypothetical protein